MSLKTGIVLAGVLAASHWMATGQNADKALAFSKAAEAKIVPNQPSVQGDDPNWLFLVKELRQIALGKFWEQAWESVAANKTNPVPSMVEFHNLLSAKGIDLIVVPVPAKSSIYPEKLVEGYSVDDPVSITPFLGEMRTAGLTVIDLDPIMKSWRTEFPDKKIYCEQDAHFTPFACEQIAALLAAEMVDLTESGGGGLSVSDEETLSIVGDQVRDSQWSGTIGPEKLSIRYAGKTGSGGKVIPVDPDEKSPILLLGDSHTLVFHEGESGGMHCKGGGVFDHLSASVGSPIDLVGVRGSGLMQARKQLFYKVASLPDYWEGKEVVVWIFSVREFTQSVDKIISIPLER